MAGAADENGKQSRRAGREQPLAGPVRAGHEASANSWPSSGRPCCNGLAAEPRQIAGAGSTRRSAKTPGIPRLLGLFGVVRGALGACATQPSPIAQAGETGPRLLGLWHEGILWRAASGNSPASVAHPTMREIPGFPRLLGSFGMCVTRSGLG